jgi:small subunit ribosomal protein S6
MRAYELMIILDGDLDDTVVEAGVRRISEQIVAKGAEIKTTDRWGKRRFAYEINHKVEGYYVVLELVAEGTGLDDLERQLRLADDVVRHKLIRLPDKEAAKRNLLGAPAPA